MSRRLVCNLNNTLNSTVWIFGLASILSLSSLNIPHHAQAENIWALQDSPSVQRLPDIENQLYGHAYPSQSTNQRVGRVEKTLFGEIIHGPVDARIQRIDSKLQEHKSRASQNAQEPILAYLEDKLFQRTFPERSMTERVRQLETHVFGRSFDQYPLSIRVKKLTYAMPLMAKEVRVSSGDVVVASSKSPLKKYRSNTFSPEIVQLDAKSPTLIRPSVTPSNNISVGDYFAHIHRTSSGKVLRWSELPIKVYLKPSPENSRAISAQAIKNWQNVFSVEATPSASQADIIISWDKSDWDQNPSTVLTRLVTQINDNNSIRTVVLITLHPAQNQSTEQQLHLATHQLGHAFGLWGHSDDPDDVMYPSSHLESNDFPARWRWRSEASSPQTVDIDEPGYQPSQRDINTLLKLYDQPVSDLSTFSPY